MSQEAAGIKPLADAARKAAKARFDRIKADPAYKAVANEDIACRRTFTAGGQVRAELHRQRQGRPCEEHEGQPWRARRSQTRRSPGHRWTTWRTWPRRTRRRASSSRSATTRVLRQLGPKAGDLFDPQTKQTVEQIGRVAKYASAQPKGSYVNNSHSFVGCGCGCDQERR
jgi:hypothetical protein